jgi:hypothetical protein
MGVLDDVLCNNDLFGKHKGETHPTQGLNPVFPESTYEITPSGHLERLECTYEDRSEPNAPGWKQFVGLMTPVFTGQRHDMDLYGWIEFPGVGRAKFTDGTMVAFEPNSDQGTPVPMQERTGARTVPSLNLEAPIYMQGEAHGTFRVHGRKVEAICGNCGEAETAVVIRENHRRSIVNRSGRGSMPGIQSERVILIESNAGEIVPQAKLATDMHGFVIMVPPGQGGELLLDMLWRITMAYAGKPRMLSSRGRPCARWSRRCGAKTAGKTSRYRGKKVKPKRESET